MLSHIDLSEYDVQKRYFSLYHHLEVLNNPSGPSSTSSMHGCFYFFRSNQWGSCPWVRDEYIYIYEWIHGLDFFSFHSWSYYFCWEWKVIKKVLVLTRSKKDPKKKSYTFDSALETCPSDVLISLHALVLDVFQWSCSVRSSRVRPGHLNDYFGSLGLVKTFHEINVFK